MQVKIRRPDCCGNGVCVEIAPDVFGIDSRNKAIVLDAEAATAEMLKEAAEACPCQAIELEDDQGNTFP